MSPVVSIYDPYLKDIILYYCGKPIATSIPNYPTTSLTSAKLPTTFYITSM
ncbi:hypothetical protein CONCODRAFT_12481 [Conidiobolus coronatus NRRL 28638]|uniref:Uncharacterized protein n=1 Tax=Conidiobolus coronatus (strain ATCC 28846 / CBS 209.66 / NRRL 28638) TaxID=796925 RepID=A0A137NSW1_CONC2|nr:hypothetical protein CONCODRAFT_12481 [Conidiobolus coronatus NRRL 28638]|eukprot:KXN65829.1 hypothetical protein CONCODRAFT_12481 [Conidiobolus coronatus NRRL 28638]